ncbi:MAG: PSD1 and planctomycete cytochrome C domain-containing protein [Verrucomicrobiota bacterium]
MPPLRLLTLLCLMLSGGVPSVQAEDDITFFESKVRPLLVTHCLDCHGAEKQKGGLRLDSRAAWQAGGENGAALIPGDGERSRLIAAVRYRDQDLQMPPKQKLGDAEIATLEEWVRRGAPDPREGAVKLADRFDPVEARKFWAFQPVKNPEPPKLENESWPRGEIDRFILAKLRENHLEPKPEAPRRTLARRLFFDLTGLPPSPEQADAFVADGSPDALEKLVDSLLASPAYGERQARWWLDAARYADTNGQDENKVMANAWRYRDWVVEAFNGNLPFDEFITDQLAGDLLPETEDQPGKAARLAATGFLVLGPKMLAEQDKEKLVMDIVDEQVDTVGRAFMGLTLGCARCHDHKFDPVTARDYYALAGIFKSTRVMEDLAFVSKFNERPLEPPERLAAVKDHAERTADVKKRLDAAAAQANEALLAAWKKDFPRYLPAAAGSGPAEELDAGVLARLKPLLAPGHPLQPKLAAAARAPDQAAALPDQPDLKEALYGKDGVLALPADPRPAYPAETRDALAVLEKERDALAAAAPPPVAQALAVTEATPVDLPVMIRGSHLNPGPEAVPRGFIQVAMRPGETSSGIEAGHSGRLELARWLTSPEHPLTARVIVNRLWQQHFGTGIVASADNFGLRGDLPTHPELLDWLAHEFVRSGWNVKALHRRIVLSAAYRQAAVPAADPGAKFLAGFPRQRLEAEMVRDSLLAVSGTLDRTVGGTLIDWKNAEYTPADTVSAASLRRSLYLPVVRDRVNEFLTVFDFANPGVSTARRTPTVVSHQALFFLNSPQVLEASQALAKELSSKPREEAIAMAYRRILSRPPQENEGSRARQFLETVPPDAAIPGPGVSALAALCQTLLATNEFIYSN